MFLVLERPHLKKLKTVLQSNYFYVGAFLFLLFYIFLFTKVIKYDSRYLYRDDSLSGRILDYNIDGDKLSLVVKGYEKVSATYYIKSEVEKIRLSKSLLLGSDISLIGEFSIPSNNTIPNTFNYKEYLYNKKIYRVFKVESYKLSKDVPLIYVIKNAIKKRINDSKVSAYLNTFVLGDKRELDDNVYSNYQKSGISHLFAISGMHISLFSMMLFKLLTLFKLNEKKRFLIVIIFLWFYAFLTGFLASILRALVFMMFLNLNKLYELKLSNIKCLFLTVLLILFVSPFMIYDLGFQYSSLTVFGLLLHSDFIKGNYIIRLFKTSIIAFIYSMPLTIYNFYEINLLSPIINIIFVPLVSFVIYPVLLLSFLFPFLSDITIFLINIMEYFNSFFANINIFVVNYPKINFILIIFFYILLFIYSKTKRRFFVILMIILMLFNYIKPKLDNKLYLYFLDVGQGDSSIIVSPYQRELIMIDTGGVLSYSSNYEWQKRTKNYSKSYNTISFIKSLGLKKIDKLILSHGDYDHMGEAINLVENFKVENVIFNCGPYNDLENELIKVLDKKKINHYSCIKELNIDKNKLYFLQTKEYDNENDNSNVIYTELNGYKFMFMGDASVTTEEEITNNYNLSNIDVLKVGHHGSKTSSGKEFINEINPKYSIISVGKNNRYGHPNKEVLNILDNSKIYRTDQDGSIMFKIKNNELKIETCSS